MQDIMQIDYKQAFGRVRTMDPGKQEVFYIQNGIEYGADGKACNAKQVKEHYTKLAAEAQAQADAAKEAAAAAQKQADELLASAKARISKKSA